MANCARITEVGPRSQVRGRTRWLKELLLNSWVRISHYCSSATISLCYSGLFSKVKCWTVFTRWYIQSLQCFETVGHTNAYNTV